MGFLREEAGELNTGCIGPDGITPISPLDNILRQPQQAYTRTDQFTSALATLYAGLKTDGCQWFDGPKTDYVLGEAYTRLAVPGASVAEAIALFIVALSKHLDGAKQVAWADRPTLERNADGAATVKARFAIWKDD